MSESSTSVVILAGGLGTRLRDVLGDVPKALAPVGGQPALEHHVRLAERYGLTEVIVLIGVGAEQITTFCERATWHIPVRALREPKPIGTAGALMLALPGLPERFIVAYGDTMMDVALDRLLAFHTRHRAAVTMLVHPNDHPHDSDLVDASPEGHVRAVYGYPHPPESVRANLVNAALYVVEREALLPYAQGMEGRDIAKHLLPQMLDDGLPIVAYRSREYIKDLGTPDRLARVNTHYDAGIIARRNIEVAAPAVFLDRDGTLNREVGHLSTPEQLELLPGVATAIRRLNQSGMLAVLITNQPVVARGECTEDDLRAIHARLDMLLGAGGAYLDASYFCPHHPDRGFPGERPELKVNCACRKPAPGMIAQAAAELNIDLAHSWMIGDSTADIALAERAGVGSILVRTGNAGTDGKYINVPSHTCESLGDAVDFVLRQPSLTPPPRQHAT